MRIDVILPLYNEEDNLPLLRERLMASLEKAGVNWRVIYVNDGSRDRTESLAREHNSQDPRFTLVNLSRNFGLQGALAAGLDFADADAVIVADGDLQDPPELIPEMVAKWQAGAQVVIARRKSRRETGPRRWAFEAFHLLFNYLSDYPIPTQTGNFCLLDRQAARHLRALSERHRFFPGLRAWIGFRQEFIHYDRMERHDGTPQQTFPRLISLAMDAIFSFSYKPLRIMTAIGVMISFLGFVLAFSFVLRRLLGIEIAQTGFTTLVTLILFLGGLQLISIGILGEYLGRIYDEVKNRPIYLVGDTCGDLTGGDKGSLRS